jgi:hypothetical protein
MGGGNQKGDAQDLFHGHGEENGALDRDDGGNGARPTKGKAAIPAESRKSNRECGW